ncbi:MAG TPA: response regulator, partial [Candidatus Acidoferrum sp.]|nr:response regulator [Candidatus Acidoferrum sp.]
ATTIKREGQAPPLPYKAGEGNESGRAPCPLGQVVSSAQVIGASDTLVFVLIDGINAQCSNTFCITVSRLEWVSGGRSVAKILVADDNSNIQKMVGLALKDQGIDVVAVGNGEAAVRKISDIRPDLVLADVFMPVRNGYEVCKYVKDDRTLAHIPVILLVGAFDPLDEQEAQRVGADGVLKKPFVPPDPLISMVKSALQRAGVSLEKEPAAAEKTTEKAPVGGARVAKEVLGPVASAKLAAVTAVPEAEVEPVLGTFSTPGPASVKFAAGNEPLAFGSLLETPEVEDDLTFTAKPTEALEAARHWGTSKEEDEVEEEEGEEGSGHGHAAWRPAGLDETLEEIATTSGAPKAQDWRDEGFHGHSPANGSAGHKWTPTTEATPIVEAAEAPRVGTSTLENKPVGSPAPFAGDAWAAALATTVQEKIADVNERATELSAPVDANATVIEPLPQPVEAAGPANWASVTETPWELEAKKASMLAATWDAPAAAAPPSMNETAQFLKEEPAAAVSETPSSVVNEFVEQTAFHGASEFNHDQQAEVAEAPAASAESSELKSPEGSYDLPALDFSTPETVTESAYASSAPSELNEAQEVQGYQEPEPNYGSHVEAPAVAEEMVHDATPAPAGLQQVDMDALVARVVAKMNPDVLQRVTQEILKPVIEALIKDELASKR